MASYSLNGAWSKPTHRKLHKISLSHEGPRLWVQIGAIQDLFPETYRWRKDGMNAIPWCSLISTTTSIVTPLRLLGFHGHWHLGQDLRLVLGQDWLEVVGWLVDWLVEWVGGCWFFIALEGWVTLIEMETSIAEQIESLIARDQSPFKKYLTKSWKGFNKNLAIS